MAEASEERGSVVFRPRLKPLYVTERMDLTPEALDASLRRTKPQRWETLMGTAAQTWVQEDRAEGSAALLLRQLERRFGRLPSTMRDRVRGATADDVG